jgi:metal-responsive CopG/Arc/MetJ family transcriptional regulator
LTVGEYIHILIKVTTTVHIPGDLLKRVDRRAGELGISRNRYIIGALEKATEEEASWSPPFLETLAEAAADRESHAAIDELMHVISSSRSRKRSPRL